MMRENDAIDTGINVVVAENPGCSVFDAIKPFLIERSESVLRQRIRALGFKKELRLEKTKHKVRCFIENPEAEV